MSQVIIAENPVKSKEEKNSSKTYPAVKGGEFIIQNSEVDEFFISEDFDEEARMIGDLVKDFCIKEIQEPFFRNGRELEVTNKADKAEMLAILKRSGELGLCGVSIPESYGGMGLDFKTNTLISTQLPHGFSFATTLGAQTSIGCLPIVYYGNEAQKQKYLPKIATAEYVASYALTEPTAGSDANSGKTKAVLSKDKQHFILNGQKIWITNGGFADVYIVFAKIEDDKNLSAFIVERHFEGFSIGAEEKKFGIKGSSTVQIFFDDCKVPVENLLGAREEGFKMALTILNGGRIKAGAGGVGGAMFALNRAAEYAKTRKQFGKTIAEFGVIQAKIGDIATKTFAIETALFRTADLIDRKEANLLADGATANEAKIKATGEFAIEAAICKVKGSDLCCYAIDEAMQIHGGMGYAAETGLGMGYRDARITKIYEGTNEINAMLAVGELSKRALQTKELDLMGAGKKIPSFIFGQINPFRSTTEEHEQRRIIQGLKNTFLYITGAAGKHFKKKLVEEQEIIMHLSIILQEAYVAESVYLKVKKLAKKDKIDTQKFTIQQQMMRLYLYEALSKAKHAAIEAIASFATGSQQKRHNRIIRILLKPYFINPKNLRRNIAKAIVEQGGYNF